MEENKTESNETEMASEMSEKSGGMNWMIAIIVLVLVFVGGYYYMTKSKTTDDAMMEKTSEEQAMKEEGSTGEEVMEEKTGTEEEGTMMEDKEVMAEADATGVQAVSVEGGMYYYKPNKIVVKKGVPVKVTFVSVEGMHDFVVDDLDVKSKIVTEGKTTEVEFTVDKAGEYEFYCSVGDHKARGMVGTLVVE